MEHFHVSACVPRTQHLFHVTSSNGRGAAPKPIANGQSKHFGRRSIDGTRETSMLHPLLSVRRFAPQFSTAVLFFVHARTRSVRTDLLGIAKGNIHGLMDLKQRATGILDLPKRHQGVANGIM